MKNSIFVIKPYKCEGLWVFDDANVGLVKEPFVGGADTMIDVATAHIPNAEKVFLAVFSASYFFHTSETYSLIAVYVLFLVTLILLVGALASLAYLVLPARFGPALWDRRDWARNEAIMVATSVLLILTLAIVDVFPDEAGRQAHLDGAVAAALLDQAADLLSEPPEIREVDVLATTLPTTARGS